MSTNRTWIFLLHEATTQNHEGPTRIQQHKTLHIDDLHRMSNSKIAKTPKHMYLSKIDSNITPSLIITDSTQASSLSLYQCSCLGTKGKAKQLVIKTKASP